MAISDLQRARAIAALRGEPLPEEMPPEDMSGETAFVPQEGAEAQAHRGVAAGFATDQPGVGIVQQAPPGTNDLDAPPFVEGKANTGMSSDVAGGALGELDLDRRLLDMPIVGKARGVVESGENPAAAGGYRGRERFDQTFDTAPQMAMEAMQEGADVQEKESKDLEAFYKNEQGRASDVQAFVNQRQQADQNEMLRRQAEIDEKTKMYSQNLSDRGAFWKNPGNIIAAIGFALLPFASEDKAIGVKLLTNAINEDFKGRQVSADSNLGALKSNLQGYRQLAGDRHTGDLLAQAEAYRIAAMEVQRIANSYQGAKSQAAAKALIADLISKSNLTAMQAYKQLMYISPQTMTPQMRDALRSQPGYQSFAPGQKRNPEGVEYIYDQSGNVVDVKFTGKQMPGQPPPAGAPGTARPRADLSGFLDAKGGAVPKTADDLALENMEKRSPGISGMIRNFKDNLTLWAMSSVENPQANPEKVRTKRAELLKEIKGQTDKISAQMAPKENDLAGSALFQKDLADVEAAFGGDQAAINSFLGYLKGHPGEIEIRNALMKVGWGDDKVNANREKLARLSQVINGNINAYYKQTSGGAVSDKEQARLEKVISQNSPFALIKSFANDLSRRQAGDLKNALAGQNSLAVQYYLIRMGQQFPALNNPGAK